MILIWRGLGFLAALLTLVGAALGVAVATPLGMPLAGVGAGALLGGAGAAALGWWLNVVRPEAEITKARDDLRQDLWGRVRAGQFQMAPGAPAPRDEQDAQHQVESVVTSYEPQFKKLRNRHTLFWVPMQFASAALAVVGLLIMVLGVVQVVTGG